MTDLQNELLKMLGWFHEFCVKNNLRYYAIGGTMLGAIRHKGFIPWDDDIDVGMPRSDYEKLIKLSPFLPKPYIMETPQSAAKDFVYAFSKIYNTNTTLIEKGKRNITRGIYLDVFPLDGLGNSEQEAKKNFKKTANLVKRLAVRVSPVRKGRGFLKNCAVIISRCIPHFLLSDKKLAQKLDVVSSQLSFDDSKYVGNLVCNYKMNNILYRKNFGTPKLYDFESIMIYGAENFDGYLTQVFGDWRKLPPESEQISYHLRNELSLDKSYLKYGENKCKQ